MTDSIDVLYLDHLRELVQRTDRALANASFDSLAVYSGAPHDQFLDDRPYPYCVNPHFKAWVPLLHAPHSWLLYEPGIKPTLIFLQPADYWHLPPEAPHGYWTESFDIRVIREPAEARALFPPRRKRAFIGEWSQTFADWPIAAQNPPGLLEELHYFRAFKTSYEVQQMRLASLKGVTGHRAAERAFRDGVSEFEIHLEYLRATRHTEEDLPYTNIIALNRHGAVLHYQHLDRTAPASADRRSFLIDAGAQQVGYACDITRTYSYRDDDFAELIAGMHKLQLELCAEVKSGVDYAQIHLSAHRKIAALLKEADVIRMSPESAVESGLSSVFFPHGVGHLLGLQVHDVSGFSVDPRGTQKPRPAGHPYLRLTRTLAPGCVVTIEPGLYFIDMLLAAARENEHGKSINWTEVERLKEFGGIRIEDDVLCTAAEPENLTRAAFAATL
jgi:Xaa-Pro dipeptidase